MILNTITALAPRYARRSDPPERPLVVVPPCQSDIKRTLRRAGSVENAVYHWAFRVAPGAHSPLMVNRRFPFEICSWFRNGGWRRAPQFGLNAKFTANRFSPLFSQIARKLNSMQLLAVYRETLVKRRLRDQPQR